MWKTVGTILLVAFVVIVGKVLLREYIRHETGKGVAVSAQDDVAVSAKSKDYKYETCTEELINEAKRDCVEGEARGCAIVGYCYYLYGLSDDFDVDETRERWKQAILYSQKGCDLNFASACQDTGRIYKTLSNVYDIAYDKKAEEYYQKGCDLNDGESCVQLGGFGNNSQRVKYWQKACELGNSTVCNFVGKWYENGDYGVRMDLDKAIKYYKKDCDLSGFCSNYERLTGRQ